MNKVILAKIDQNLLLRDISLNNITDKLTGDPTLDKPYLKFFSKDNILSYPSVSKTVFQYGYDNNRGNLNDIAYNFFGTKITYGDYYKNIVYKLVASLQYCGIKPNDYVAVSTPNSIETFAFIDALSYIGAIPSIFDPRAKDEELVSYLNEVNCKMMIVMDAFSENLEAIIDKTNVKTVVVTDITTYMNLIMKSIVNLNMKKVNINKDFIKWQDFINYSDRVGIINNPIEYKSGSIFSIAHTSGTSNGLSKGVIITNGNMNSISEQYRNSTFTFNRQDRFLSPTPVHLIYGLSLQRTAHSLGLINYIQPEYNPEMTAKMVMKNKINHIGAGTDDADKIKEELMKRKHYDASHIHTLATGGGRYNQVSKNECISELKKHNCFINVTEGYGLTENTGPAVTNFPNAYKEDSIGIPFPYVDVAIIDPNTLKRVMPGNAGELLIHSSSMTIGYANNKNDNSQLFIELDGTKYLRTHDKVRMDADGFMFYEGRYSNIIPLYTGENISPYVIEKVIKNHPAVKDCIVIGVKDLEHNQGEIPWTNIELNEEYENYDSELLIEKIKKLCVDNLKPEYVPDNFIFVDNILHTKNGKIDYHKTKEINEKIQSESRQVKRIKYQKIN